MTTPRYSRAFSPMETTSYNWRVLARDTASISPYVFAEFDLRRNQTGKVLCDSHSVPKFAGATNQQMDNLLQISIYLSNILPLRYHIGQIIYRRYPVPHVPRYTISADIDRGCTIFIACLFISQFLSGIFSCIPVSDFWETFTLGPRCVNVVGAIRVNGGINAATDFILLAMVKQQNSHFPT